MSVSVTFQLQSPRKLYIATEKYYVKYQNSKNLHPEEKDLAYISIDIS